ncbi:MAG: HAD-IIA family hydrolase [Clostridia bacterium]|nr:HAD-IIA family hydrolase [Clostridia bacterium]
MIYKGNIEKIKNCEGFICDMDGVIYHGNELLPGVKEFVNYLQENDKKFLFLTNASGKSPKELQQKLKRMGLDLKEENFYTSALATAAFLAKQAPSCSVYAIGEPGLFNALYDEGITLNDVDPDYVIIGETFSYNLDLMCKAMRLVEKGARLIATNTDLTYPNESGNVPACRALVAPIELTTGRKAYFIGKPNPLMMRAALRMLGCHSAETAMIGDNMETDIIAGIESGLNSVLVLSGVSTLDNIKVYPYQPSCIIDGVGDLLK